MKYLFVLSLLIFSITFTQAQFSINAFAGAANYQGDLEPDKFTFNHSKFAFGIGASYQFTPHVNARIMGTFGKISAGDRSTSNASRNLSFTSKINEFQLAGEYVFTDMDASRVMPYVFAGVAVFSFNPYTYDTTGTKYFLKPLSTEGQGFIEGRDAYKLTQFAIPFGAGVRFAVTDRLRLGAEVGFRKTFTDYLDDVSTTYVDQNLLLANRGAKAVELAYRGGELKTGATYPPGGSQRGQASKKDWYYFTGITASFRLGGGDGGNGGKGKNGVGCPALKTVY